MSQPRCSLLTMRCSTFENVKFAHALFDETFKFWTSRVHTERLILCLRTVIDSGTDIDDVVPTSELRENITMLSFAPACCARMSGV